MARQKITKRTVELAPVPAGNDAFVWDTETRGFGLRITPKGVRSYVLQYRLRNRPSRRLTIGMHGSPWTAELARNEALRLLTLVRKDVDPAELNKRRAQDAINLEFGSYAEKFRDGYLKLKWNSFWSLAYRRLEQHVLPRFKGRSLPTISRSEISALLDSIRDKPALALSVYAVLRKLFVWALSRGDLVASPMTDMISPPGLKSRKRTLLELELVAIWRASYKLSDPFGPFVRLLICTLQRRNEVAGLSWQELSRDKALWSLPGERAKNGVDHLIPLNQLALKQLESIGWRNSGLLFTTTGRSPISGFSKAKIALNEAVAPILQSLSSYDANESQHLIERWTFHDIRRTGTTCMQSLGVPIEVTEKVINHTSGETAGIRGVYNLYTYSEEKRRALEAWGTYVEQLLSHSNSSKSPLG